MGEQGFDFFDTLPAALNPLGLPAQNDVRIITWSMNMDVLVPISERLTFKGEYFNGANLGTFLGGIGQGVCPCLRQAVRANGGWAELGYDITSRWHTHAGFGIDDPNVEADALLGRKYNQFIFTNTTYDLTKKLNVGPRGHLLENPLLRSPARPDHPGPRRINRVRIRRKLRILKAYDFALLLSRVHVEHLGGYDLGTRCS